MGCGEGDIEDLGGVELQHRRVLFDHLGLHVVSAGAGPAVVLLHGFPEDWWSWRHQIPPLVRAGYSVWVPDLRGYGRSDRPAHTDAYDLRRLVDDIVSLVRTTGPGHAHLVGHDWGGIIAWSLAGYYPELVDKLVIMNAPHLELYAQKVWRTSQAMRSVYVPFFALPWLPERALSAKRFLLLRMMMRRLAVRQQTLTDADIDRYMSALAQPGALTAALAYYRANLRGAPLTWARASRVRADTLVIWGLDDPALSSALLEGLDAVAPGVRVHAIAACGHWVHAEAADEVNARMLTFFGPADAISDRPPRRA